jgi:ribonuclease Y
MILEAGERAAGAGQRAGIVAEGDRDDGAACAFRTSYAQNVLDHSVEVARLGGEPRGRVGLEHGSRQAGRAPCTTSAKALGPEWEGPHAHHGHGVPAERVGERESVSCTPLGAHHYEIEPVTAEAILVIIADSRSAPQATGREA